jgi:protein gp37
MATTSIEWAERSWNFLAGCSLASPGCKNCYAAPMAARIERMNPALEHYRGLTKPSKTGPQWTGKIGFAGDKKLMEPLRVRKPSMWFVNSMSDLFHEDVPDELIDRAFAVMALAPQHTFQVLTKRSARMREYCSTEGIRYRIEDAAYEMEAKHYPLPIAWPLPNVWLGVSVEDQKRADERIPDLLATPAAVRWISAEPLLGPVDIRPYMPNALWNDLPSWKEPELDWVVVGGESGKGARPFDPAWARSLRNQCAAAGVPFFMKQMGGAMKAHLPPIPDDLMIRQFPHARKS